MSVPLDARRELWAWRYAEESFRLCRDCCEHILTSGLKPKDSLYYSLGFAAIVSYCRPFKRANAVQKLPETIIPQEFQSCHQRALEIRDQAYAHVDADVRARRRDKPSVQLIFRVVSERETKFAIFQIRMQREFISKMIGLTKVLEDKCDYHTRKLWEAHKKHFPTKLGAYIIGLDSSEPEFEQTDVSQIDAANVR